VNGALISTKTPAIQFLHQPFEWDINQISAGVTNPLVLCCVRGYGGFLWCKDGLSDIAAPTLLQVLNSSPLNPIWRLEAWTPVWATKEWFHVFCYSNMGTDFQADGRNPYGALPRQ
jgi:hypothetical protein